jgi:hypothetical protein
MITLKLTTTALAALLVTTPVWAQRPLGANQLPSGTATYTGTLISSDFTTPLTLTVNFDAGTLSGSVTIPALGTPPDQSPQENFGLTGKSDVDGGYLVSGGGLDVGAFIVLGGTFVKGKAQATNGQFVAGLTVEEEGVTRGRTGTYTATKMGDDNQ